MRTLILDGKLSPCWKPCPDDQGDECLICLESYPSVNLTSCCHQEICTECFLQCVRPHPNGTLPVCPFCKQKDLCVIYLGPTPPEQRAKAREQQQAVEAAQRRATAELVRAATVGTDASASAAATMAVQTAPSDDSLVRNVASSSSSSSSSSTDTSRRSDATGSSDEIVAAAAAAGAREEATLVSASSSSSGSSGGGSCSGSSVSYSKALPLLEIQDSAVDITFAGRGEDGCRLPDHSCQLPLSLRPSLMESLRPQPQRVLVRMVLAGSSGSASGVAAADPAGQPALAASPLPQAAVLLAAAEAGAPGLPIVPALPEQGGAAILQHPDGSQQLMLLLSPAAIEAAAAATAAAARKQATAADLLSSYQAPSSEQDSLMRVAIERADASMRRALVQPSLTVCAAPAPPAATAGVTSGAPVAGPVLPPSPDDWLQRMREADAAVRRAVEQADSQARQRSVVTLQGT